MPCSFQKSDNPRLDQYLIGKNEIEFENEENVEEEQEFSFAPFDDQKIVKFADEIFHNGKMRTTIISFDQYLFSPIAHHNNTFSLQPPLKKLFFVQQLNEFSSQSKGGVLKGSCNETVVEVEASNKKSKKSKSASFSKIWRFKESLKLRSNSDDKDAFVFFNPSQSNMMKKDSGISKKERCGKCKTTLSPHEKLYVMNKKNTETTKRKSFLPYKKNLIGLFTNVNKFSKNLNPF
ncbi:unnamed protein product [Sphenostylis stenocarpa]|uniref:Uncharacterized protein n=1 Tax=Sphenostylis stenocarpa TaxID=92480 RepID=A0AA86VXH1_9FABA|nr:unnamed protein product [Sphenostylis stenocarpa]